ncbi:hypothetical protein GCM10028808_72860 [Spirosoma migulaei]
MNFDLLPHKEGKRQSVAVKNAKITIIHTEQQRYSIVATEPDGKKIITAFAKVSLANVPDMITVAEALINRQGQTAVNPFNIN